MGNKLNCNLDERHMIDEYINGTAVCTLMTKYGYKTKKSITDKIKKYYPSDYTKIITLAKQNRKKFKYNFEHINCEFDAYFVGLMLSDGYIQDQHKFGIQLTDEDAIRFISQITAQEYHCYTSNNETHKPFYRIIFSDAAQCAALQRYGIVPNKSKIISPPKLFADEIPYIPYIIRGLIDGDGCIYQTSDGSPAFYICTMSYEFAVWIKQILEQNLHMDDISIHQRHYGIWIVETALQTNLFKLIALVYNKPFGMMRKYDYLRKTFRDYNSGNPLFLLD